MSWFSHNGCCSPFLLDCGKSQVYLPEGVSVSCGSLMKSSSSFSPLSYFMWKRRGRTSSGASVTEQQLASWLIMVFVGCKASPNLGSLRQCLGFHYWPVSFRLALPAYTRLAQSILGQKRSRIVVSCSASGRPVKGETDRKSDQLTQVKYLFCKPTGRVF